MCHAHVGGNFSAGFQKTFDRGRAEFFTAVSNIFIRISRMRQVKSRLRSFWLLMIQLYPIYRGYPEIFDQNYSYFLTAGKTLKRHFLLHILILKYLNRSALFASSKLCSPNAICLTERALRTSEAPSSSFWYRADGLNDDLEQCLDLFFFKASTAEQSLSSQTTKTSIRQ